MIITEYSASEMFEIGKTLKQEIKEPLMAVSRGYKVKSVGSV